ncbi:MAG: YqjD family protein [Methylovirgula sp.]
MTDHEDNKTVQDLAADLAALREDLMKLTGSVRDLVQTQATTTTKRVVGVVDDARHKLADEMADAKDHLESHLGSMTADLESTIERSPLMAVLVGAAVGFLLGLVSRPHK